MNKAIFNPQCVQCPRLSKFLKQVKHDYPDYHARPVAPFGVANPKLLIVGLAPGMHGANATGRPFTGDYAGILLYETLYKYGFSNKPEAVALDDGLKLKQCRITNAVKCLPPENKPTTQEINTCNHYLAQELKLMKAGSSILVLGNIAHQAVLKAMELKRKDYPFSHGAHFLLPGNLHLYSSYHCSRYNTQTKRLTTGLFHDVFRKIRKRLDSNA
ncbi:MAG: uracil-DNA glycosylase [Gammaproteobacteria bacterium]